MAKGIYVGRFTENQLRRKEDKKAVEAKKAEYGLNYVNTEFVKKGGKIVAMDIWVCSLEDCDQFK